MEFGIVLPRQIQNLRRRLPSILEEDNELTPFTRRLLASLYDELVELDRKIAVIEQQVSGPAHKASESSQRIAAVEGIGPLTATALVAALSDGKAFQNGRQFAAWLGLVPRQHSSGGKPRLFGYQQAGRCLPANVVDPRSTVCGVPRGAKEDRAASGSPTNSGGWEPRRLASPSPTRTRASCGR